MQRIILKDEEDIELTIEDAEDIEEWKRVFQFENSNWNILFFT